MPYLIMKIHGLANKPPAAQLEAGCRKAILEGLKRNCGNTEQQIEFASIYWADVCYKEEGAKDPDDEPYIAAPGTGPLPKYEDRWIDHLKETGLSLGGSALDWGKHYADAHRIADTVLQKKLKDLHRYYNEPTLRSELRRRLKDALVAVGSNTRIMLLAHSMGSIIAYDVLRDIGRDNPRFQLDHFVTLGSPLGLPHVLSRIRQENHEVRTPSVVARWTNLADRRDPVALDVHLANDYRANDREVKVSDNLVINGYVSPSREANYHKIYGYLRAPELSEMIRTFI